MNFQRKKKLGQLLCEKAYLDEPSLEVGLAEQKLEHQPLGQILVKLSYITQTQLNEVLALQVGIEKRDRARQGRTKIGRDVVVVALVRVQFDGQTKL